MKYFFTLLIVSITFIASSQQWVSTTPENKRALIEEFTGVQCAGCPAGADEIHHLLQTYPGKLFASGYHQPNTLFCVPYGNDPDLRRSFLAAYADPAFNFIGAYPTGFVNRRMWPNETNRNFYITSWEQCMHSINAEPSPLNIGLHPVYDPATKILTVDVEVYFTSTALDPLNLYVQFSESGMITIQKNGSVYDSNYVHAHVFREAMCAQWGDPLTNTTQGNLFTATYTFDNGQNQYIMPNCEVLVFVRNGYNEEIVTVNGEDVQIQTGIKENNAESFSVYPNPFNEIVNLTVKNNETSDIRITDLTGRDVTSKIKLVTNTEVVTLDFSEVTGGYYFIKSGEKVVKVLKK